ncbi:MAG: PEP-CTERM sorting domain-containing protein [Planctomycetota bacterium]
MSNDSSLSRPNRSLESLFLCLGLALVCAQPDFAMGAAPSMVDFENVPVGTLFGAAVGNMPGDMVLAQNGIQVSLEPFYLGNFVGFYRAEVGGKYDDYFPSTPLDLNNISVDFDFTRLGYPVGRVTVDYMEFGGSNNLSVNGRSLYELASFDLLPELVAPGVIASVDQGVLMLEGPIDFVRIGGQELAIDNVLAVPEPASVLLMIAGGVVPILCHLRRRRNGVLCASRS